MAMTAASTRSPPSACPMPGMRPRAQQRHEAVAHHVAGGIADQRRRSQRIAAARRPYSPRQGGDAACSEVQVGLLEAGPTRCDSDISQEGDPLRRLKLSYDDSALNSGICVMASYDAGRRGHPPGTVGKATLAILEFSTDLPEGRSQRGEPS